MKSEEFDRGATFNPYEVVIRLKEEPPQYGAIKGTDEIFGIASLDKILRRYKPKEVLFSPRRRSRGWTFTVVFSAPTDIPQVVRILKANEFVKDASPRYFYHLAGIR